jgi:hypothetical protein
MENEIMRKNSQEKGKGHKAKYGRDREQRTQGNSASLGTKKEASKTT